MFSTPAELTINEAEYDALLDEYEKARRGRPGRLDEQIDKKSSRVLPRLLSRTELRP
jgi:hypothetical protein